MMFVQLTIIAIGVFLGLKLMSKLQTWASDRKPSFWKMAGLNSLAAFLGSFVMFGIMAFALSMNLDKEIEYYFVFYMGLLSGLMFAGLSMLGYVLIGSIYWIRGRFS